MDSAFDHEGFRRLSKYVEQKNLTHPVFIILSPFPGTDLYEMVKGNLITEGFRAHGFLPYRSISKLPLDEFYEEFLGLYRRAYPFKKFVKSIAQRKAALSPKTIFMNLKLRKRMDSLRNHHDFVRRATRA